jgi:hypothetical protein
MRLSASFDGENSLSIHPQFLGIGLKEHIPVKGKVG